VADGSVTLDAARWSPSSHFISIRPSTLLDLLLADADAEQAADNVEEFVRNNDQAEIESLSEFSTAVSSENLQAALELNDNVDVELTEQQRAGLVPTYATLDDQQRERLETLLEQSTADEIDFLAEADTETVQVLVSDGDRAAAYREAVLQAVDTESTLSVDEIDDAVRKIQNIDDATKRARGQYIITEAGGEGGFKFIADADATTLEKVLSFDVDTSGTELPNNLGDQVSVSLAKEYSRGHFSFNSWADNVYDVGSETAVAREIAEDIEALNNNEAVEGLGRLLTKEAGDGSSGGGSYLAEVRSLSPSASDAPLKGAALELRVARAEAPSPDSDDVLRLDYEPDTDFTDIRELNDTDDALGKIAEKVYGTRDEIDKQTVADDLGLQSGGTDAEFDAVRDSDGDLKLYVESKNRATVTKADLNDQMSRYLAHQIINGDTDLSDAKVTVYTRTQEQAEELNDAFSGDWFTARAPPDIDE